VTGEVEDNLGKYLRGGPVVRVKQNISLDWDGNAWAALRYFRQSGYLDYDEVRHVPKYDLWSLQASTRASRTWC
jgi:iron complex outermembrane receptor protein